MPTDRCLIIPHHPHLRQHSTQSLLFSPRDLRGRRKSKPRTDVHYLPEGSIMDEDHLEGCLQTLELLFLSFQRKNSDE